MMIIMKTRQTSYTTNHVSRSLAGSAREGGRSKKETIVVVAANWLSELGANQNELRSKLRKRLEPNELN